MGGHGGLNILPQKRWNVYNYENREKVRRDEEAAAREEQLAREQSRKRDTESRLEKLRQLRGLAPPSEAVKAEKPVEAQPEAVEAKSDSNHINLFEGIKIFDPIEIKEEAAPRVNKKMKKEEVRVVTAEDEKYRLGYGIVGKGTKLPWYMVKPSHNEADKRDKDEDSEEDDRSVEIAKKSSGKKSLEELREERLKRERKEKEREKALLMEKSRRAGGFSSRRR